MWYLNHLWFCADWELTSETIDTGLTLAREIGVNGGEETPSDFSTTFGDSKNLDTCNAIAFWLLEGMEKHRETINGGIGRGDAVLDAVEGFLFVEVCSWFLNINGAEWPTKPEDFAGLVAKGFGGRGSSWSSLILGEETRGGEAVGDTLGDVFVWGTGAWESNPDTIWGSSV